MCTSCEKEKKTRQTFAEIIKEFGLTDEQVEFYKQYSLERSRRAYEIVAAEELGSDELVQDWRYNGYYDAGYRGADYCSAGHALRYVHLAQNVKDGRIIKFGIKCVTDFFKLTPAQIKFIKNGFAQANQEIQESLDEYIKWKGDFDKYEEENKLSAKLAFILEHDMNRLKLASDDFMNMLKITEIKTLLNLRLFLPTYFKYSIDRAYRSIAREIGESLEHKKDDNKPVINPHQAIFDYLQASHPDAYRTAVSIWNNSQVTSLTEKQSSLFNKLMTTRWQEIDAIVKSVTSKQTMVKANYFDIFDSLSNQYTKWGMSEKQFNLLNKCLKAQA